MLEARAVDIDGNLLSPLRDVTVGSLTLHLVRPPRIDLGVLPHRLAPFLSTADVEVQIWRPGETAPRLWGIPGDPVKDEEAGTFSIPVYGIEAELARRAVVTDPTATLTYTATEQHDIAWDLISRTQAEPGGDLGIDPAAYSASGVTRDATFHGYEPEMVSEALDAFRKATDGFDWSIEPVAANRREWTPYYPSRGSLHPEWEVGYGPGTRGNAAGYGLRILRDRITRRHYAIGGGDGPSRLIGVYLDPTVGTGRRLRESTSSESTSIVNAATLDSHAQAQVDARKDVVSVVTSVTVTGPSALVTGIRPGDRIPIRVVDGDVNLSGTYRVVSASWPSDLDRVTLSLDPTA